jgi:hypothetical protein
MSDSVNMATRLKLHRDIVFSGIVEPNPNRAVVGVVHGVGVVDGGRGRAREIRDIAHCGCTSTFVSPL